jgi:uncharacterized membrane protein
VSSPQAPSQPVAAPVPVPGPAAEPSLPPDHHRPFGGSTFGVEAERFARFFGTPTFILGQTGIVILWIVLNALAVTNTIAWDRYPFIALNLAFSLQAAYAAPLILLAQTRQADRDKVRDTNLQSHREAEARHQETLLDREKKLAEQHLRLLQLNTDLTQQVAGLTTELHSVICQKKPAS